VEWDYDLYLKAQANPLHMVRHFVNLMVDDFHVSQLLVFAVRIAVFLAPTRKVRIALAIGGALALGLLIQIHLKSHYYSPAAGLILVLVMTGVRYRRNVGFFILLLVDQIRYPLEPEFPLQRHEIISRLVQQAYGSL
jgi:hypothetical protein